MNVIITIVITFIVNGRKSSCNKPPLYYIYSQSRYKRGVSTYKEEKKVAVGASFSVYNKVRKLNTQQPRPNI